MKKVTKNLSPVYSLISALLVITLTACSAGVPSESNARSVFENEHSKEIKEGVLKIDSFEKTNGQKINIFGVEAYKVEYKANVTYPKGILPECLGDNWPTNIYWKCFNARISGIVSKHPGQKETINGEIVFEKTEKGWKGEDGEIY